MPTEQKKNNGREKNRLNERKKKTYCTVCSSCSGDCKQYSYVTVVRCPHFCPVCGAYGETAADAQE